MSTMADPSSAPPAESGQAADSSSLFTGKVLFWCLVVPLVAADLWTKSWAFAFLADQHGGNFSMTNRYPVFDTRLVDFELVNYLNHGTIWGLGQDWHSVLRWLRVGAIFVILWFVYKTPRTATWSKIALGLIMAGALGNLYDNFLHEFDVSTMGTRLAQVYKGAVRDFIHVHNGESWDFPAFNVADACITVGAATLFVLLWTAPTTPKAET